MTAFAEPARVERQRPTPWDLLAPDERERILADAERWRERLAVSLGNAGFTSAEDYLAAVGAIGAERPELVDNSTPSRTTATVQPPALRLRSAATIAEPDDVDEHLVDRAIRRQQLVCFASEEGLGKTQAVIELMVRGATGAGEWLGHFGIPEPFPVVLIDEDNGESELWRRETAVLTALGIDRSTLTAYHRVSFAGMVLTDPSRQAWLLEELTRTRPALVVLDTASMMVAEEWGEPMKAAIRFLRHVATTVGCAIVLLVHLVKASREAKGPHGTRLADVMGQWGRHVDVVALMADLGDGRARFTLRKRVPPTSLVLAQRDGLWEVVAVADEAAGRHSTDDRILRAIAAGATDEESIRTALGTPERPLPRRTFYDGLRRLRGDGLVSDGRPLALTAPGEEAVA